MKYDKGLSAAITPATLNVPNSPQARNEVPEQLTDLARQLARIATDMLEKSDRNFNDPVVFADRFTRGLRQIVRVRRARDRIFSSVLFADPAWDILLDLTLARLEGNSISVSSAAIAASVPTSTALRWLKHLMDAGLIEP